MKRTPPEQDKTDPPLRDASREAARRDRQKAALKANMARRKAQAALRAEAADREQE